LRRLSVRRSFATNEFTLKFNCSGILKIIATVSVLTVDFAHMTIRKIGSILAFVGMTFGTASDLVAQENEGLTSELQVPMFQVNYVRDNVTYPQARQLCKDELRIAEQYKSELIEKHPDFLPTDLEFNAYFGEIMDPAGRPEGARCALKFYVLRSGYGVRLFDSPEKDKAEECRPYLEQNQSSKKILWQKLISGWSFFQGNWCVVRAVEVFGQ